jgi:hypothetical protein
MSFKDILSKLSQLSEATKETGKGRIHTAEPGGYGRKDDEDEEGNKVKADAPKRGRGRPKKDADASGEVKKYDNAKGLQDFMIGNKPKSKELDKLPKKKHSIKEWIQEVENKYIAEADQISIKPASQMPKQPGQTSQPGQQQVQGQPQKNTQVIAQGNKTLGTIDNPQLAQQIKQSIGKGEMTLMPGEEMAEDGGDYSAKKAAAGKDIGKPGKNFAKIAKSSGGGEKGKRIAGAVLAKLRGKMNEADIPSDDSDFGAGLGAGRSQATYEAKKAKPDYIDLDKDGNKKETMKKAASDKKKEKVTENAHRHSSARLLGKAHALAKEAYNCRYDDMEEAKMYHEGFKEGLDECYGQGVYEEAPAMPPATPGGMANQAAAEPAMDEGNAFTKALAKTPAGGKFSVGGKTFTDRSGYDATFESLDNQLTALLEGKVDEGMTVSISKGQQGAPDSVSVTAQDGEADQLLQAIKTAGLGLFGGDEGQQASSPMSLQPADGGEGEMEIDVVDDHDGMMDLIKKVTGAQPAPSKQGFGDEQGSDYEDEEGHDHEEGETCDDCGSSDCQCDDEGQEEVDEVESYDQEIEVAAEDNAPDSDNAETTADENAEAAEDQALAQSDEENVNEWANDAGEKAKDFDDETFKTDLDFMTKVISGGLNKQKATGQTTIPVVASQLGRQVAHESVSDWKKLAGIK